MIKKSKKIWITWHYQSRSRNLAEEMDLAIKEYFRNDNVFLRHFLSSIWTLKILFVNRPKIVVIQYSFLLLVLTALYKLLRFNRVKLVADCHTKALRRKARGVFNLLFWPIKLISFKAADLTIISNEGLIFDIKKLHHNFIILPDKIPDYKIVEESAKNEKYCVYVSSFAVDEPVEEIIDAAEILNSEMKLYWTGKCPPHLKEIISNQSNINLTGYLSEKEYINLIKNADCILALTTEEDCLQSAAYEALSVEVPFVISKTKALINFFGDSAIYTLHNPLQIASSVSGAVESKDDLIKKIKKVREAKEYDFQIKINELKNYLNQ